MDIKKVFSSFDFKGGLEGFREFGSGHINKTYIAEYRDGGTKTAYVVQRVNGEVFKNIDGLMKNVFAVTEYLREYIIKNGGDAERETLHFIKTKDGKNYFNSGDGGYYRAYVFVENSVSFDSADTPELFKKSGAAFGKFQRMLDGFPAEILSETIEHFHDTAWRYDNQFIPALSAADERIKERCKNEIEFVKARRGDMDRLVALLKSGGLPTRVTHNDTKLNNVLFDEKTGESLAVIDLDTVMAGSALYDFGDSIRFGASTAAEDEKDLNKVEMSLEYFKAYAEGFLSEAGDALNICEKENLAFSARLMTLECGMRFLTDYLNGNTYFKADYPEHNLVRAKNQFKLVSDMESKACQMEEIIKSIT